MAAAAAAAAAADGGGGGADILSGFWRRWEEEQSNRPWLRRFVLWWRSPGAHLLWRAAARMAVVLYFFNFSMTWFQYLYYGYTGEWHLGPFWATAALLAGMAATLTSIAATSDKKAGSEAAQASRLAQFRERFRPLSRYRLDAFVVLATLAFREMANVIYHQLMAALVRGEGVFVNELLVKKFAVAASAALLVADDPDFQPRVMASPFLRRFAGGAAGTGGGSGTAAAPGTPGGGGTPSSTLRTGRRGVAPADETRRQSAFLLAARLMIGILFLYVGYYEVSLQLQRWSGGIKHGGHQHKALDEDGHNQMWAKLPQALLALPLVLGFKMRGVAVCLASICVAESLIQWNFWNTILGTGYAIHARDHFVVNVAVAGGLWLLGSFGAGRFSVDALMAKKNA